jgi:hypothetical protein
MNTFTNTLNSFNKFFCKIRRLFRKITITSLEGPNLNLGVIKKAMSVKKIKKEDKAKKNR